VPCHSSSGSAFDLAWPFLDFRLPTGSEVSASLGNARDVIVQWLYDDQKQVIVGAKDRVSDLRTFLAAEKGVSATGILLRAGDAELEDSRPLSEPQPDIVCSFRTRRFPFHAGDDFKLELPANSTAGDAKVICKSESRE
jgi:hypothetical protein